MIQNAADAGATKVTVKFETLPSTTVPLPSAADQSTFIKHTISHHSLRRLLISNNGAPFSEKDWSRLKRIADGNPDETKIGAFGVGFYSVFDDCEEPFVSSGDQAMAFYWRGNALFTRRLQLNERTNPETTFVLDYRNDTSPVPSLMELCQFLSSSLTFVNLESIELWLDDWNILRLLKKSAPSITLSIPKDIAARTPEGLMKILNVNRQVAQVDASWMRVVEWNPHASIFRLEGLRDTTGSLRTFFSKLTGHGGSDKSAKEESHGNSSEPEDMVKMSTAAVFLHINTASIQSSIGQSLSKELERATRKPPPKNTTVAVLMPSYDAGTSSEMRSEVLSSVLPFKNGRVFIGFPTQQTTGLNAHISAPSVIPTVERESIDLNTRYISKWNLEMLRAAGITCRIAWAAEMAALKSRIPKGETSSSSNIRADDIGGILPEAIHVANQFVFRESTPSSLLGQTVEDAFWICNNNASIEVLSTGGILPSHNVRIASKDLTFMADSIAFLPDEFVSGAKEFVRKLTDFGLLTEVTVSDIKRELEASTLRPKHIVEFLAWLSRRAASGQLDPSSVRSLLNVAVANDDDSAANPPRLIIFADINGFLNQQRIPADLPTPPSVIPYRFTKSLGSRELEALGWTELQIVPWLRWLVNNAANRSEISAEQDLTSNSSFSARVMLVLSKQWENLSQSSKQTVLNLLISQTVIPTKLGMKRPAETYFPSVRLFDDLPVVHGLDGVKDKFLAALGVRKTVELGVIFERLLNISTVENGGDQRRWSHVDLIRYLASVQGDIPPGDIKRLKNASICNAEASEGPTRGERERYKISELFEPKDSLRHLGLPVIEWPDKYQPSSTEGKFLSMMGLKSHPSAPELIQLMANSVNREKLMSYFISEYHVNGYSAFDASGVNVPFLPLEGSNNLSTPGKCFTDDGASLFGFQILRQNLHVHSSKLGVARHPPLRDCIDVLIRKPPTSKRDARVVFKYLAGRATELSAWDTDRVGNAQIVPIAVEGTTGGGRMVRHVAPKLCYLGDSEDYGDIFDFVDYGQEANFFLMAIGSKREPTKMEIARMLVKEPARISSTFQNPDKYLKLLRALSEHLSVFRKDKELFSEMKRSAFLLGSKDISSDAQPKGLSEKPLGSDDYDYDDDDDDDDDDGEDQSIKEWNLTAAKDVVVVDDFQSFNLFKEHVLAAPQEEILENFYLALGATPLSSLVEERAQWGALATDQRPAGKLQKLINERSRLFLHDQSPDLIRRDVRWLERNLSVQVVHSISLTRSLRGRRISHTQKRSAIITQQAKSWTLWTCPGKHDLYEISQALVHLILMRPKLHSTLTLEMLLKTDLLELKARGYNVERILKQKAHEARMAEDRRQKQLEEERKQVQEREAAWEKAQAQQAAEREETHSLMPGNFPDSPTNKNIAADVDSERPENSQERRPRGLFANLSKRLGFEGGRQSWNIPNDNTLQSHRSENSENATAPPPYSPEDPQRHRPEKPVNFSPPHKLQTELLSAVQACRPHGSSSLYSRPQTNQISETKTYCDEKPSHDLEFAATLPSGVNVFFVKSVVERSAFLAKNQAGINLFASMLIDCAGVFSLRVDSLSVFYDPGGKTIAFNRAGSIFCNYFYFQQLHEKELLDAKSDKTEALVYWWVILCHELAHNLVEDHSSAHSYYRYAMLPIIMSGISRRTCSC